MAVRDRRKFIGPDETRAGASHRNKCRESESASCHCRHMDEGVLKALHDLTHYQYLVA